LEFNILKSQTTISKATDKMKFIALLVVAAVAVQLAAATIPCKAGFIEHECPAKYPQCCAWRTTGVIAACCPSNSVCDLAEGNCLVIANTTTAPGAAAKDAAEKQPGVTMGVSLAAALITFGSIAVIGGVLLCGFWGFRGQRAMFNWRQRRRNERAALLEAEGAVGDDNDDDDAASDCEASLCSLCYAARMDCVLMPCGHVCCCHGCADRLTICPLCRVRVRKTLRFKNRLFVPTSAADVAADVAAERAGAGESPSADADADEALPSSRSAARAPSNATSMTAREPGMTESDADDDAASADQEEPRAESSEAQPQQSTAADTAAPEVSEHEAAADDVASQGSSDARESREDRDADAVN
jgi:hypothetical protein